MIAVLAVGTVWLISGCAGAVLIDTHDAGPMRCREIAMGPLGLALGIMLATERRS